MLVWIDLETTGLDPHVDNILEVGIIVTAEDLVELGRWSAVLEYDLEKVAKVLPAAVIDMHRASGLWEACRDSDRHFSATMDEATRWLEDLRRAVPDRLRGQQWHLAGSSVWFDRSFLASWWPELLEGLGHRILDVSSLKLTAQCWGLPAYERPPSAHRAIPDLEASIAELRHWQRVMLGGAHARPLSMLDRTEADRQEVIDAERRTEALGRIRIDGEAISHQGLRCVHARELQSRLDRRTAEVERLREVIRKAAITDEPQEKLMAAVKGFTP